ncbi:MAG: carboxyl transferase domain-containing protein, partial [Rhodothermales bacterium]
MSGTDPRERLREMRCLVLEGCGAERVRQQHEKGKCTARERIDKLVDAGLFVEHQAFVRSRVSTFGLEHKHRPGDGVVTG